MTAPPDHNGMRLPCALVRARPRRMRCVAALCAAVVIWGPVAADDAALDVSAPPEVMDVRGVSSAEAVPSPGANASEFDSAESKPPAAATAAAPIDNANDTAVDRLPALAAAVTGTDLASAAALAGTTALDLILIATQTDEAAEVADAAAALADDDRTAEQILPPELPPAQRRRSIDEFVPTTAAEILAYLNSGSGLLDREPSRAPGPQATQRDLELLGKRVTAGATARLSWTPGTTFEGLEAPTPVLVVNGMRAGPTLCLTAAVHGDELNGIEIVRRVMHGIEPEELAGAVIGVPIVNLQGFHRSSRYLPDRRDLNRHFPGSPTGSAASRIAHSLLKEIVLQCTALVDLHTGSFHRTNLPQIRADLRHPAVLELTQGFGRLVVLHSAAGVGTLRRAATDAGVPTVTLEVGEPMRIEVEAVDEGVRSIAGLLHSMRMYENPSHWDEPKPVFYQSRWVRADHGGILLSEVELGTDVRKGHRLGTVVDPVTNRKSEIRAPVSGRVLGMALNQFVMPGYAAFRIGVHPRTGAPAQRSQQDETALDDVDARESELQAAARRNGRDNPHSEESE
jgi:uncharacterized protein